MPLPATRVMLIFHPCLSEGFEGFSGLELLEKDSFPCKPSPADKKAEWSDGLFSQCWPLEGRGHLRPVPPIHRPETPGWGAVARPSFSNPFLRRWILTDPVIGPRKDGPFGVELQGR